MTNIDQLIKERRTIHAYEKEPIPKEFLYQALESAIYAPNHKLTFPFRFTMVGAKARKEIAEIAVLLKEEGREGQKEKIELSAEAKDKIREGMLAAPHLIVVRCVLSSDEFRQREDYATVACAIQNMHLSLWEKGIGSKWSTGGVTTHERTYRLLGVSPEYERIVGFLWVGKAKMVPTAPKRPELQEVLTEIP